MAGHSKFKNIQHRKSAQDKKRAKLFTRLIRDITTAAKSGTDPETNARLRNAISSAKAINVPKDRIERALSQKDDTSNYEEMRYEAFLDGAAFIIECHTDNKNRTVSLVKSTFSKYGGALTTNVTFMFDHCGIIQYPQDIASEEEITEIALELEANDIKILDEEFYIYTTVNEFNRVLEGLCEKLGPPSEACIGWCAIEAGQEVTEKIAKVIEILEDNEDVQRVYTNAS